MTNSVRSDFVVRHDFMKILCVPSHSRTRLVRRQRNALLNVKRGDYSMAIFMQVCWKNRQLPENRTFSGRRASKNLSFLKTENEHSFWIRKRQERRESDVEYGFFPLSSKRHVCSTLPRWYRNNVHVRLGERRYFWTFPSLDITDRVKPIVAASDSGC